MQKLGYSNPRTTQSISKVEWFLEGNPCEKRDLKQLPDSAFNAPDNKVTFLKSLFSNRAPTAFFQYPEWIDSKKYSVRANQYGGEALEHLFMSYAMDSEYNTATVEICQHAGFSEALVTNSFYNVLFTDSSSKQLKLQGINKFQKVNQFPEANILNNKVKLLCNI